MTAAARFDAAPHEVWERFASLDALPTGPASSATVLRAGHSRHVPLAPGSVGAVEELIRNGPGRLAYRSRVPGGSRVFDHDAVVRVSQDGSGSLVTWSAEVLADNGSGDGRETLRRAFEARLVEAGGEARPPLQLDVFNGRYKSLPRKHPQSGRRATWSANTATLISGESDAILVDALMTTDETDDLVAWLRSSRKRLTTIVVTQGHADHFFGLDMVLRAFPAAVPVAVPAVAETAGAQVAPEHVAQWESLFPGQLPKSLSAPAELSASVLALESHALHLFDLGLIGGRAASVLSVRELDAVVGGDLLYNGVHPWLIGTDRASRQHWSVSLDLIEALRPAWAIAAHRDPDAPSDDAAAQVAFMRRYFADFEWAVEHSDDATTLADRMIALHPGLGNRSTAHASALAQFAGWRNGLRHQDFPDLLPPAD